jgi:hypothetical protein
MAIAGRIILRRGEYVGGRSAGLSPSSLYYTLSHTFMAWQPLNLVRRPSSLTHNRFTRAADDLSCMQNFGC